MARAIVPIVLAAGTVGVIAATGGFGAAGLIPAEVAAGTDVALGGAGAAAAGTGIGLGTVGTALGVGGIALQTASMFQAQNIANQQASSAAAAAQIQAAQERAREQAIFDQQVEQERLNREAAGREAEAIELNATFARENAAAARTAAGIESAQRAEVLRRERSRQLAAFGHVGVTLGQGTPLLVEMDALLQSSKELAALDLAGEQHVNAFQQEEAIQRVSASNVRLRRTAAPVLLPAVDRGTSLITTSPFLPAGATLLTGAGNIISRERFTRAGGRSIPSSLGFFAE